MKKLVVFSCLLVVTSLSGLVSLEEYGNSFCLTTVYGSVTIDEPVLIDLIKSPAFQRLKNIRQYGVMCYARSEPHFTRYQHSLGVFFLVKKYGAPLAEQIAALLHDVSHTIFSHVGDRFFKSNYFVGAKVSYQDTIHEWYLAQSGIVDILKVYGYEDACSDKAKKQYHCFDQSLPDLCADRIEYNLTGALIDGMISVEKVNEIIDHLHFENKQWFFDDIQAAKKFGLISVALSELRWGSPWSGFIDHSASQALQRAYELGIITLDDIHFSTDDVMWQKLITNNDSSIARYIQRIVHCQGCWSLGTPEDHDLYVHAKFSGTDPLVKTEQGLQRLTTVDADYKREFDRVKKLIVCGYYLKIKRD